MAFCLCSGGVIPYHSSCISLACEVSVMAGCSFVALAEPRPLIQTLKAPSTCYSSTYRPLCAYLELLQIEGSSHLQTGHHFPHSQYIRPQQMQSLHCRATFPRVSQTVLKIQTISLLCKRCTTHRSNKAFRLANMCSNDSALAHPSTRHP